MPVVIVSIFEKFKLRQNNEKFEDFLNYLFIVTLMKCENLATKVLLFISQGAGS